MPLSIARKAKFSLPPLSFRSVFTLSPRHKKRAHTLAVRAQNTHLPHRIIPSRVAAGRLHNRNFENALTRCAAMPSA